jgi:hypothetical protein
MPTPNDVAASSSLLANALPSMSQYILNPSSTFTHVLLSGLDVGVWALQNSNSGNSDNTSVSALVLAANTNYANISFPLSSILNPTLSAAGMSNLSLSSSGSNNNNLSVQITQVLNSGASASGTSGLSFQSVGTGAWIVELFLPGSSSSSGKSNGTSGKASSGSSSSSTSYCFSLLLLLLLPSFVIGMC